MPQHSDFDTQRFLHDIEHTCSAIKSPYSKPKTEAILKTYKTSFAQGAVLWRTTNRPSAPLNYRFYERSPTDTISRAIMAGFLSQDHPLAKLITSWSNLYPGESEQSCDFDAATGFSKTWVYLGGMRPVDEVLGAEYVPDCIRGYAGRFHALGLELVRHVAADYCSKTVNIYFRARGVLTFERALSYVRLADPECELSEEEVDEMRRCLNPTGFTFAVTMAYDTGDIKRVAVYALKLAEGVNPRMDERIVRFFAEAPSYDEEEMRAVAWSFGKGGDRYMKAEKSYCGELVPLLREWNTAMSS